MLMPDSYTCRFKDILLLRHFFRPKNLIHLLYCLSVLGSITFEVTSYVTVLPTD